MTRTKLKSAIPKFSALPKTYAKLCMMHMPRTIHDTIELDATTEIIDLMAGHELNTDHIRRTAASLHIAPGPLIALY